MPLLLVLKVNVN